MTPECKKNDVSALFERSDLFEDVMESDMDVIVSNPPYLSLIHI